MKIAKYKLSLLILASCNFVLSCSPEFSFQVDQAIRKTGILTKHKDNIVENGLVAYFNPNLDVLSQKQFKTRGQVMLIKDRFGSDHRAFSFAKDSHFALTASVKNLKSITVSLWFKAEKNDMPYPQIFSYGRGFFNAYLLGNTFGDKIGNISINADFIELKNGKTYSIEDNSANYFDNNWHYLCATFDKDKSKIQLYIDNKFKVETSIENRELIDSDFIQMGHSELLSDRADKSWFTGAMSDIRIYNRSLTTDEMNQLFNEGN